MPLSLTGIASGSSPIKAAHLIQFFNLLTGAMTDQPVTLKNTLLIGGNQATTDKLLTLVGVSAQTGAMLRALLASGDTQPSWSIDKNGAITWGVGGTTVTDTTLQRMAAGILQISNILQLPEIATPGAPGAGVGIIYFKNDDHPYYRAGAAGAETRLDSTAANITDPLVAQVFT